jgi:hypothetical protein
MITHQERLSFDLSDSIAELDEILLSGHAPTA